MGGGGGAMDFTIVNLKPYLKWQNLVGTTGLKMSSKTSE